MATLSAVDSFWATFREMRKLLYRHISLLFIVTIPITYQIICVEFIIEELVREHSTNGTRATSAGHNTSAPSHRPVVIFASKQTEEFQRLQNALVAVHFGSMLLGVILLGMTADRYGRLRVLFPSTIVMFIAAFSSAFFLTKFFLYILLRFIVGLAAGGAALCVFTLTAEYADPCLRAYVVSTIWLAAAIGNISFSGLAYAIVNIESLLAAVSLPLVVSLLIWRMVPESPRWKLLHSSVGPMEESRMLLRRYVSEEKQDERKFRSCLSLWGHFSLTSRSESREAEPEWRWWRCLRDKEFRKIFFTLCFSWFAVGLLFRALDTKSIQLLHNFYANYAVRSLITLPAIFVHCFLVNWAGRRFTTTLCLTCGGLICLISLMLTSKHHSTTEFVDIIVQLIGRGFVETSIITLALYTMELFPTVLRCSVFGIMAGVKFFAIAVSPSVMKMDSDHPTVPLGIMGSLGILAALLCRLVLPETKGTMTRETLDDSEKFSTQFDSNRSPKIHRRARRISAEFEESGRNSPDGASSEELMENFEDSAKDTCSLENTLGQSWELSFDRTSHTSRWEWLSYEDAYRRSYSMVDSLSIEQSLKGESNILTEEDIKKLSKRLPGSTWILVYSTYHHGITLSTLYHRMRDFDTPVLVAIKDSKGYVFGVFAPMSVRVDPNFYGAGRSFFFTCKPEFKVFPYSGKNEYYMNGEVDSLAFGCTEGNFGLWLDKDLYHGRSTACETYDSDVLSGTEDFICHGLEAWIFE